MGNHYGLTINNLVTSPEDFFLILYTKQTNSIHDTCTPIIFPFKKPANKQKIVCFLNQCNQLKLIHQNMWRF